VNDISLRPVDPVSDAALLHDWVTQPRAEFWGMVGKPFEEVDEIGQFYDRLPGDVGVHLLMADSTTPSTRASSPSPRSSAS
jgi:Acetyltransferase (GNAT) domain